MSLLMQALKKAERAKQNAGDEPELDRPSQEFDDVLALTPTSPTATSASAAPDGAPARAMATDSGEQRASSLDFAPDFSLEPLPPAAPAASLTPRPAPDPLPAPSDHGAPGLTLDLAPDPAAPPAPPHAASSAAAPQASPSSPSPSFTAQHAERPELVTAATAGVAGAAAMAGAAAASQASARTAPPRDAAPPPEAAAPRAGAAGATRAAGRADAAPPARARNAARTRAANAAAEPPGMDPERLRLIGLLTILALIIIGFAYYYWQAVMAPGAGARLPPVAMPPPGATGATPVQVVGAAPAGAIDPAFAGSADPASLANPGGADVTAGGMLAPSMNRSARDDIERRLARTEQELAAAQQAIQQQAQAAAAPRPERLPPVAAPESADIRVARAVQPSPVAPALQTAYAALASGDLVNARQQYEAALRQDGNNRDALLGLATVAVRQHDSAQASAAYLRLLELDPNDATAVAGLVGLRGSDPGQSERRLKAILASNPDAGPVLFALGNVYAQGSRWSEAQQAYFRAYTAAPDNPDYAYNLAIGLDRLNQGPLALSYYQRALALAQDKAVAFDRAALRQRMHELGGAR